MAERSGSSWEQIRQSASDVERLIGQKQYNLAMVKARQSLEYMVKSLAEPAGIEVEDLEKRVIIFNIAFGSLEFCMLFGDPYKISGQLECLSAVFLFHRILSI